MSVLISGSIAYDNILSYGSRFSDHLIPGSLDHINLSFVTDNMIRGYGGCAANIAYSLKMLGGDPLVIGAVGTDGRDYQVYFEMHGIDTALVKLNDTFTAQCFTTTDITGAQITAFNPGAMLRSHEAPFPEDRKIELAIVGPDGKQAMQQRSRELAIRKIPFIFDIGQGAPLFNGEEMKEMLYLADYAVASDYEADLMTRATGLTVDQIASGLKAFIITHGEKGSTVYYDGRPWTCRLLKVTPLIPWARATPTAADSFTVLPTATTGSRRCALPPSWGPSRWKARALRPTRPRRKKSPRSTKRLTAKRLNSKVCPQGL